MEMSKRKVFHVTVDGWYEAKLVYAVTMFDSPNGGVLVWAGRLQFSALKKPPDQIESGDYMQKQTTTFSSWDEAWSYLDSQPKFASVVPRLRRMVDGE